MKYQLMSGIQSQSFSVIISQSHPKIYYLYILCLLICISVLYNIYSICIYQCSIISLYISVLYNIYSIIYHVPITCALLLNVMWSQSYVEYSSLGPYTNKKYSGLYSTFKTLLFIFYLNIESSIFYKSILISSWCITPRKYVFISWSKRILYRQFFQISMYCNILYMSAHTPFFIIQNSKIIFLWVINPYILCLYKRKTSHGF